MQKSKLLSKNRLALLAIISTALPAWADVTMTCGAGNKATATITTGAGWEMNGAHTGGAWQSSYVAPASNPKTAAGQKAGNWNATFADWLTPGSFASNISTTNAHHWRTKVILDSTIDPSSVQMVVGSSRMYADDRMNSIHVVQDDSMPAGTAKEYTGHHLDGSGFTDGLGGNPTINITGGWKEGDNWLVFKLSNDDYEDRHAFADSKANRTGPTGFTASIELEADCAPPPPPPPPIRSAGPSPVPVNSPWMLGALGAGLALLGARGRRKQGSPKKGTDSR